MFIFVFAPFPHPHPHRPTGLLLFSSPLLFSLPLHDAAVLLNRLAPMLQFLLELPHPGTQIRGRWGGNGNGQMK